MVEECTEDYKQAMINNQMAINAYQDEKISTQEYKTSYGNLQYYKEKMEAVEEFQKKLTYKNNIKQQQGIDIWMISDRQYNQIFGRYAFSRELILLLLMITGIMLTTANSFSIESSANMRQLLNTTEKGRDSLRIKKWAVCSGFTLVFSFLVFGIDFINMLHMYGMPFFNAPVLSLSFVKINMVTSHAFVRIWTWMVFLCFLKIAVCLSSMVIAMGVSHLTSKKMNQAILPLMLGFMLIIASLVFAMLKQTFYF